ncbi:MAG: hypothetical protein KJ659_02495 [Actinobacteria bacterium]|nr:hypothetical protein [Actinomycetota bacterium]MBU1609170.1 hypothetical protein [Actinomycetota bacterium]MBU2316773.1 hypothetical protein [Actinomycetota bacterium]MBU2384357.1 hypothetical protein [Actinomycetota bacterium]
MTTGERWWLWSQPLVAAIALLAGVAAWILQAADQYALLPSVQSVVTGTFVLPGLAVSLALNHVIVLRRAVPILTSGEKLLLVAQYALAIIVVATSLDPAALLLGYLLWPLLIVAAVSACVTMARTTRADRRGEQWTSPLGPTTDEVPLVDSSTR